MLYNENADLFVIGVETSIRIPTMHVCRTLLVMDILLKGLKITYNDYLANKAVR
jgi:hypothetical protein